VSPKLHPPTARSKSVVVKPAKPYPRRKRTCLHVAVDACRAELRSDHPARDVVCDCHEHADYNPRHDAGLDLRVLCVLHLCGGEPVNLYSAFGCESTWANQDAFRHAVARLNASGLVQIVGVHSVGYKMVRRRARKDLG